MTLTPPNVIRRILEPVFRVRLRLKALILEHRSAAYIVVCEQWSAENRGF